MRLLDLMDDERLDDYVDLIRELDRDNPDCWHIVYAACAEMRSSGFDRIRRRLEIAHAAGKDKDGFDVARPWNAVIKVAVADENWWDKKVYRKAMEYRTQLISAQRAVRQETAQPSWNLSHGSDAVEWGPESPTKRPRTPQPKQKAQPAGANEPTCWCFPSDVTTKKGNPFCGSYNTKKGCQSGYDSICVGMHGVQTNGPQQV